MAAAQIGGKGALLPWQHKRYTLFVAIFLLGYWAFLFAYRSYIKGNVACALPHCNDFCWRQRASWRVCAALVFVRACVFLFFCFFVLQNLCGQLVAGRNVLAQIKLFYLIHNRMGWRVRDVVGV